MIYDIESPAWWKLIVPHKNGKPLRVYYRHRVKDWCLVRDPFSTWRYYWADPTTKVWRGTPPPWDKDAECQTSPAFFTSLSTEAECQTVAPCCMEAECQTVGFFTPDPPADTDVWAALGSSVASLPQDQQTMIYNRLVRFLELGWHDLRTLSL